MRTAGYFCFCVFFLAVLTVSAGCTTDANYNYDPLDKVYIFDERLYGTSWELSGSLFPMTLNFDTSSIASGFGGVNSFTTNYSIENDTLRFDVIVATKNDGPTSMLLDEANYFARLESVEFYQLRYDELVLMDKDGNLVLHFDRVGRYSDLSETQWIVTNISGADYLSLTDDIISLDFRQEGIFSGFVNANSYNGFYSAVGSDLILGSFTSNNNLATSEDVELEELYFSRLMDVEKFQLDEDTLVLSSGENVPIVVLRKRLGVENLVAVPWKVKVFLSDDTLSAPVLGSEITLVFDKSGNYSGLTGVQPYSGEYHVSGKALAVTKPDVSEVFESDELLIQEKQYLKDLENVFSYQITSTSYLAMYDSYGNLVIIFEHDVATPL